MPGTPGATLPTGEGYRRLLQLVGSQDM